MPKVFNVEQLRLNGRLLTGSAEGLFFDRDKNGFGEQLAAGTNAVPIDYEIQAGLGLKFDVDGTAADSTDFTEDAPIKIYVNYDDSTITTDNDILEVKDDGIGKDQLAAGVAGAGLSLDDGVGGQGLYVNVDSDTIEVNLDILRVKANGIGETHIANNAVGDDQLDTITAANQIYGQVVHTDNDTITFDNGVTEKPLKIKAAGVGIIEIDDEVAGAGLGGGNDGVASPTALEVIVDDSTLTINNTLVTNSLKVKDEGVTYAKMQHVVTADRLLGALTADSDVAEVQVNTAMLLDDAVTYAKMQDISTDHRLLGRDHNTNEFVTEVRVATDMVVDDAITYGKMQNVVSANRLLGSATAGGIVAELQVVTDMIEDDAVTAAKLDTAYLESVAGTAGDGMTLTAGVLDVVGKDNGGLTVDANEMSVDNTVVRTSASADQLLEGDYRFKEIVSFLSGITVAGGLVVQGATFVTEANEVNIGDEIIVLNADYQGASPSDAGIELNRGDKVTQEIIFDDFGRDQWVLGPQGGEGVIHTEARLAVDNYTYNSVLQKRYEGVFSMSKQLKSGVVRESVLFSEANDIAAFANDTNELARIPNVVVTIQNTGVAVNDPSTINGAIEPFGDLVSCMVTKVNTTGFNVDFSSAIPSSGTMSDYRIKAWVMADTNAEEPGTSYAPRFNP